MKTRSGFTIIELLTVMVIIMILAGSVFGIGKRAREIALENRAKTDFAALEAAICAYRNDTGHFPPMGFFPCNIFRAHLQLGVMPPAMTPLKTKPPPNDTIDVTGWKGPYMHFREEDMIEAEPQSYADPWGTMYFYTLPGDANKSGVHYFDLWSAGPDTDSNDEFPETLLDDINNW